MIYRVTVKGADSDSVDVEARNAREAMQRAEAMYFMQCRFNVKALSAEEVRADG